MSAVLDLQPSPRELTELSESPELMFQAGTVFRILPSITLSDFENMLGAAFRGGISDVHCSSGDYVYFDLHGRLHRASNRRLSDADMKSLVTQLADESALGVLNGGEPINRAITIMPASPQLRGTSYRWRLNCVKARIGKLLNGFQLTMRSIPDTPPELSTLNLPQNLLDNLFPKKGLCLVVGPTGSGKTTKLFSALRFIAETDPNMKIMTAEEPVEFTFEHVKCVGPIPSQVEIGIDLPSYGKAISEFMRRKGNIFLIGECRKRDELQELVNAALSGHMTYSTLHAGSVEETVHRIVNMFPSEDQAAIASSLLGVLKIVVAQILVPSIDGKRRAAREWLVFDHTLIERMSETHFSDWPRMIRKSVFERGNSMLHSVYALYAEGAIAEDVFFSTVHMRPDAARHHLYGDAYALA